MFLLLQLKEMRLDSGTLGISQIHAVLLFALVFAIAMFPYVWLYRVLAERPAKAETSAKPFRTTMQRMMEWVHMHAHRHPQLLHH